MGMGVTFYMNAEIAFQQQDPYGFGHQKRVLGWIWVWLEYIVLYKRA